MKFYDFQLRVRYQETDQMGVVYYANYLTWFEVARTEFFRAMNLTYTEFEENGIYLPVCDAYCKYLRSARYDNLLTVRVWVKALKRTKLEFGYYVFNTETGELLTEGFTTHVFVNKEMKPLRIPDSITRTVKVIEKPE